MQELSIRSVQRAGSVQTILCPVNGLHLYSAFIQSALQFCLSFTPSHTYGTIAGRYHARPERQEPFGVQSLTPGHSTMWTGGAGDRTTNPALLRAIFRL